MAKLKKKCPYHLVIGERFPFRAFVKKSRDENVKRGSNARDEEEIPRDKEEIPRDHLMSCPKSIRPTQNALSVNVCLCSVAP